MKKFNFSELEEILDYRFKDQLLLKVALTHSSKANEHYCCKTPMKSNERLEFLGDSVLNLIISKYLFKTCPEMDEGQLTRVRAMIVCESALAQVAEILKISSFIMLGKGEEISGGRKRTSIMADAVEAVIGAIYMDGHYFEAEKFILTKMQDIIERSIKDKNNADYKSRLQDYVQSKSSSKITYMVTDEQGPDHDKLFSVKVEVEGIDFGEGTGKNKKEAEQKAAQDVYNKIVKKSDTNEKHK